MISPLSCSDPGCDVNENAVHRNTMHPATTNNVEKAFFLPIILFLPSSLALCKRWSGICQFWRSGSLEKDGKAGSYMARFKNVILSRVRFNGIELKLMVNVASEHLMATTDAETFMLRNFPTPILFGVSSSNSTLHTSLSLFRCMGIMVFEFLTRL